MPFRSLTLPLLIATAFCTAAPAATITNLVGDKDGFGAGVADGASFNFRDVGPPDIALTDVWMGGARTITHLYDLSGFGPITSASLAVFTGGQGLDAPTQILFDDIKIGTLTDGDGFDGGDNMNRAWLDVFDLTDFIDVLDGSNRVTISTALIGDGWAWDYSELTIVADEIAPIPLPATLLPAWAGPVWAWAGREAQNHKISWKWRG